MDDAHEDRFRQHEEILTGLARILGEQHTINTRLTTAIESLATTQARIETLLARMIGPAPNGREA